MTNTTICRGCGEDIAFDRNKNDRWAPVHPISREPHRCQTERTCEGPGCGKTFKGASWMKLCPDCFRVQGGGRKRAQDEPSPPRPKEELKPAPLGDDSDVPF